MLHAEESGSFTLDGVRVEAVAKGGYDKLKIKTFTLVEDSLGPSDVLVSVKSCGLNFADIYIRHGLNPYIQPPCVLGLECAGLVEVVGSEVTNIKAKDRVVVHRPCGGALANFVVAPATSVLKLPDCVTFDEAAAVTINYLTAYFAVHHSGKLQPGSSVLIHSAAGGVGWAATQIAKSVADVTVIGIASSTKHEAIKENGVDYPISYDQNCKEEVLKIFPDGVSLVLDTQSGSDFSISQSLLAPLGTVVLLGSKNMIGKEYPNVWKILNTWWETKKVCPYSLIMNNRSVSGLNLNELAFKAPDVFTKAWEHIIQLLAEKKISPRIDSVWNLADVVDATQHMADRKNIGKIILNP